MLPSTSRQKNFKYWDQNSLEKKKNQQLFAYKSRFAK